MADHKEDRGTRTDALWTPGGIVVLLVMVLLGGAVVGVNVWNRTMRPAPASESPLRAGVGEGGERTAGHRPPGRR